MRAFAVFSATVIALVLGYATTAYAAPGDLDSSFDGDGKLTTSFGATDAAQDVAVQKDGKIVAAGFTFNGTNKDFALARYNTNGSLDPDFGSGGKVVTPVSLHNIADGHDEARAVAVQSDSKIVVAGYYYNSGNNDFALARYKPDGSLDETFFNGNVGPGIVTTRFSAADESAHSVAIQEDGKIVAAGYGTEVGAQKFALARYNTDGLLDTDFNTSGKLTVSFTGATAHAQDVAIQEDGKIIAAGYSLVEDAGNHTYDFALTRRNADGSPDISFGQDLDGNGTPDGKVLTSLGSGHDHAKALALQPDGKIVLSGYSSNGTDDDFALTRYEADGSPDETFDGDGKLTTAVGSGDDQARGLTIQSDGKLVAAGYSGEDFALTRYYGESYTTAPEVSKATPNGKKVSPNANVTASFSHKMDSLTVNTATFKLFKKGSTKAIKAKVSYSAAKKKAILNPNRNLRAGTTYKAVVVGGTDGVKDVSGNALAESETWSFRVRK